MAASEPPKFRPPAAFQVEGCRVTINKGTGKSWTNAYADAMVDLAKRDSRVIALTAAMPDGTGLSKFEPIYPDRYFDTGICESHLTAMAAGMAKSGLRPFAAIYTTVMPRGVEQVWPGGGRDALSVGLCTGRGGGLGGSRAGA